MPQRLEALGLDDFGWLSAGGWCYGWAWSGRKEGRGTIFAGPNFDGAGFTFIDFPPYFDGCRPVDGGDGKCGSPDGYLKKAVHEDFPDTHPAAAAMFKNYHSN